jgi:Big-like domain-containing protein
MSVVRRCRPLVLLLSVFIACAHAGSCGTSPSVPDHEATSCGSANLAGGLQVDPRLAVINEGGVTVSVGGSEKRSACFYRDLRRPSDRQAITWSSLDPSVASVSPSTGPETTVAGVSFGKTKIRALITGMSVEVFAVVCEAGRCPPPPY